MANPVTIDIPGIGSVVANNAATEATLKEILKAIQGGEGGGYKKGGKPGDAKNKENAGDAGGGSGGAAGGKGGGGASSAALFGKTIGAMIRPVQMATGAFFALGSQTTSLINAFANAGDSFSGAASVFSGIPVLGGIFSAVAAAADKVLGSYQSATASGATFGGSMNNFAAAASGAGMTMEKFGGLIARNGEALMTLGGTTEEGAKRFANMSKEIRTSGIGNQLYGLGMTTEQVNEGMATYLKTYGASGALQGKSTKELALGAGQYLKELDGLAKITGQSRKALEDEQAARLKDSQFRAAIANLDADQAKMMNNFVSSFPKEQQEAVKEMIATGNITSEAGIMLNNSMPGLAQSVIAQGNAVKAGVKVSQDSYDQIYKNGVKEAKIASKSSEMQSQAMYNQGQMGNAYVGMAELAKRDIDGKEKALTAQEQAAKSQAAAMEKAKQNIAAVSNSFQMVLANSGLLNLLMDAFSFAADVVMKYIVPAFEIFGTVVTAVGGLLIDSIQPAFAWLGGFINDTLYPAFLTVAGYIMADVVPMFQDLASVVRDYVWPALQSAGAVIEEYVYPVMKAVANFIADNLTPILLGLGTALIGWGLYVAASTVAGWLQTAATMAAALGVGGLAAAAWAAAAPILAIVLPVIALIGIFKLLYDKGFTLSSAWDALKDNLERFGMHIMGFIDNLRSKLPPMLGGLSDDEAKARADLREQRVKELDDKEKARDEDRAEKIKERSSEEKEKKRSEASAKIDQKLVDMKNKHAGGVESANKKTEDALNKSAQLNYDDPTQLLTGFAAQQKSALIQNPASNVASSETGRKTIENEAVQKADAEKRAKEAINKGVPFDANAGTTNPGSTTPAATQDSPSSLLASLNTKMDQLIKISKTHQELGAVQVTKLGQLSNDLYSGVG